LQFNDTNKTNNTNVIYNLLTSYITFMYSHINLWLRFMFLNFNLFVKIAKKASK